ncbi:DUF1028 domain-containing protein [Proteiniclasticum sp. C24MP]|uniref:DUF1028 domain-containing protein n=1 Tax=Proteiniclasticum sp. C24MP TaxID=3374101 RepID=UPI003753F70D
MKNIATFSIIGFDPVTEELGIAVQSKFLGVGAVVPWAKAGVGAIATQAMANLHYGELGLELLERGYTAEETLHALLALDPDHEERQVGIVDASGNGVSYTGKNCFSYAGGLSGENFACQGNILVGEETVTALKEVFFNISGTLAERLVSALDAAQHAGGDKRGRQSAALLVVKEKGSYGGYNDRAIDLRVDDHPQPIRELQRLLQLHEMYFQKTKEEEKLPAEHEYVEKLQKSLGKLGYYKGSMHGRYDEETRKSYEQFCGVENFEERMIPGNWLDKNVLDFLEKRAEQE